MKRFAITLTSLLAVLVLSTASAAATPKQPAPAEPYVVLTTEGANIAALAPISRTAHIYNRVHGFAAQLTADEVAKLRNAPGVVSVTRDAVVRVADAQAAGGAGGKRPVSAQTTPTGIMRINNPAALRNGSADVMDVDIAIIDTGIAPLADLNIVQSVDCVGDGRTGDPNGHGTHVAGTAAARDDAYGVVGVAPGARLHAIRVLNAQGEGTISDVVCGIDYVAAHASEIEVANMSLGGYGSDNSCALEPMHAAICTLHAAGVTLVVAAGNYAIDASGFMPAAYDEPIAVSAYADFDGKSGSRARRGCYSDADDSFASFSNFGADVDISAPGVCILSTYPGGTATLSGTSMAAPHVAGAAALYKRLNPTASPADVKAALQAAADMSAPADDPDGVWEGLLQTAGLG